MGIGELPVNRIFAWSLPVYSKSEPTELNVTMLIEDSSKIKVKSP